MAQGLAVSDVVNVTVSVSPTATPTRNFGAGLHVGVTDVIDTVERLRSYSNIEGVGGDFGTTDPEYIAAQRHFAQVPQPSILYIGRWAQAATSGLLRGGVLNASEQLLAAWTAVTAGSFKLDIDGTTKTLSALNFSAALNLPGVAAIIDTALTGASVRWDANSGRFIVESDTTGVLSTVGYATATGSGTDISAQLKLTVALAGTPVVGIAAETLVQSIQAFVDTSGDWYAAVVLPAVANDVFLAAAQYVEALGKKRIIGKTITSSTVLDNTVTTDLASVCKAAGLSRTFLQYSNDPYAIASFFGRASSVDFTGSKTTMTMMFKVEPGVTPERVTETQAATLKAKCCNIFVYYDTGDAIIQHGVMSSGRFFDSVHGWDWAQNAIQTTVWSLLRTRKTKIPQTNQGMCEISTAIETVLHQSTVNGLVAPGQWNGDAFGSLETGDYLESGYYVYFPDISSQSPSDRAARKAVPFQIAAKEAGAVHSVSIAVDVDL